MSVKEGGIRYFPDASSLEIRTKSNLIVPEVLKILKFRKILQNSADHIKVSPLRNGRSSSVFLITQGNKDFVIKIMSKGAKAEGEWLKICLQNGVNTPTVYASGYIRPTPELNTKPVGYLVLEGVRNNERAISKNGKDYEEDEGALQIIASKMGEVLGKIHVIKSDRLFGRFKDNLEFGKPKKTWTEFLIANLKPGELRKLGILKKERQEIIEAIKKIKFPDQGAYCHGDFGVHNGLVVSLEPPIIYIFDPNPLIGDPYWDLAAEFNRIELKKAKALAISDNSQYQKAWKSGQIYFDSFLSAYLRSTNTSIDNRRLVANQIVKILFSVRFEEKVNESLMTKSETKERRIVWNQRRKLIREKVNLLLKGF